MTVKKPTHRRFRYSATVAYILTIVATNTLFLYMPIVNFLGFRVTTADFTTGAIFIVRDLAQREIRHYVMIAMAIGGFLTYLLVDRTLAVASITAFVVSESIDWSIFSLTKKPLSKRLLWSSLLSCPADSFVFSELAGYTSMDAIIMSIAKFAGVFILWYLWQRRKNKS